MKQGLPFVWFLGVLGMGLLQACSDDAKKAPTPQLVLRDSLFGDSQKDFRMVSFGDYRENVTLGDGPTVIENEANRLVEKITVDNEDSTYAEVYYIFRENRLCEAEINVFTRTDSVLQHVWKTIEKELHKRYGSSAQEGGFSSWSGKSRGGYRLEIYLGNRTGEFKLPTLQLIFRAELIETPRMAAVLR